MPAKRSVLAGSVEDYLAVLPEDARVALEKLRRIIKNAAPGAIEVISYRIPVVKFQGHLLVGFGATENYCSFYLMSSSMIPKLRRARDGELKGYDVSGATIHFSPEKMFPAALVTRLVKERIAENEKRASKTG